MGRSSDSGTLRLRQSVSAMGTTFSILLYGSSREEMEAAAQAGLAEVRRLDRLLSGYRPDSELSVVNREAAGRHVAVSPESFRLIAVCLEHSRRTDGAFDVTVGPLKRAWGFYRGTGRIPAREELAAARRHVGYRLVELDAEAGTIRFDHPGVELDPGGVGKGYAVDRVVDILRARGFGAALVVGSKSSIYGLGAPPSDPSGWRADIADPQRPADCVERVVLKDASLSTSGSAEQCYWSDGAMYSHIVDPRTGWPIQSVEQVSVVTSSSLDGEIWAKACLLNGRRWAAEHKPEGTRILFCGAEDAQRREWV